MVMKRRRDARALPFLKRRRRSEWRLPREAARGSPPRHVRSTDDILAAAALQVQVSLLPLMGTAVVTCATCIS